MPFHVVCPEAPKAADRFRYLLSWPRSSSGTDMTLCRRSSWPCVVAFPAGASAPGSDAPRGLVRENIPRGATPARRTRANRTDCIRNLGRPRAAAAAGPRTPQVRACRRTRPRGLRSANLPVRDRPRPPARNDRCPVPTRLVPVPARAARARWRPRVPAAVQPWLGATRGRHGNRRLSNGRDAAFEHGTARRDWSGCRHDPIRPARAERCDGHAKNVCRARRPASRIPGRSNDRVAVRAG